MKRLIGILMVSGLLAGAALLLTAQSTTPLRAEIPFGFYVGDTWMPPGEYLAANVKPGVIHVRSTDARENAFRIGVRTDPAKPAERNALVFRKYGEARYFLGELVYAGAVMPGVYLPESRHEKEVVEATLLTGVKPTKVVILAYAK